MANVPACRIFYAKYIFSRFFLAFPRYTHAFFAFSRLSSIYPDFFSFFRFSRFFDAKLQDFSDFSAFLGKNAFFVEKTNYVFEKFSARILTWVRF